MDLTTVQPLLDWLNLHQQWVAIAIFLIAFFESLALAGVIIPGVALLFGASAVAGSGALALFPALGFALIGAVLGDCSSFFLGKFFKQQIRGIWPFRKYPEWINNGEAFFARHGGKSIVIGRFVGPIRPVIPLVAGTLDMPSLRFVLINLLSALAWAPTYVLPGFLFGRSISWGIAFPKGFGTLIGYTLIVLLLAFLLIKLCHWHLSHESRLYLAIQRMIERQSHTRLFWYWLSDRRDGTQTFPLNSLTLMIASLTGFAVTAWLLTHSSLIADIDRNVFLFFRSIQHPWLDRIFSIITLLTNSTPYYFVSSVLIGWLLLKRQVAAALICLGTILISEALVSGLKSSFALARPLLHENGLPSLTAFPSSHASRAAIFFGLIAAFVAQEMAHRQRWWIYGLALIPMTLMAISRLYLERHWLTDVVAGLLLGIACCGAARTIFSRYNLQPLRVDRSLILAMGISILGLLAYIIYGFASVMAWIESSHTLRPVLPL